MFQRKIQNGQKIDRKHHLCYSSSKKGLLLNPPLYSVLEKSAYHLIVAISVELPKYVHFVIVPDEFEILKKAVGIQPQTARTWRNLNLRRNIDKCGNGKLKIGFNFT